METLRIAYADFWPEWGKEDFITPILSKKYNIVVDQKSPDVLFHSIFGGMRESQKYKCKKVLFLGENHRPERFGSDYSISFDPHTVSNFRIPLWQVFILNNSEIKAQLFNRTRFEISEFKRFCSFTISNGANFLRNSAYHILSGYKPVHSYGRYMTNSMDLQKISEGSYWRDAKNDFFKKVPHKFSLVYENTPYPYYCTEKLMDAFLAGSLPIYNGDPKVNEDWNEKAFINTQKNLHWIEMIKEVDGNDELFLEIYNEPVFTESQKQKHIENLEKFEEWLLTIVL